MTLSMEFLVALFCILGVFGPAMFYMGRLSQRVTTIEQAQRVLFDKIDRLVDSIIEASKNGGVIHCPLAEQDECAVRNRMVEKGGSR